MLDADIYGHSVPAMLGVADARPTAVEDMIMPVPTQGLKVISIGMLKPKRDQVVAWRGPILDRALTQMLADVYWGDLDYLLLDLPPGTGDVAISLGQKLPNAEVLVVTTPQQAAAEVAERAGTMASMMNQRVIGVVENMSYLAVTCPHCGEEQRHEVFGSGGGDAVAQGLTTRLGYDVPVLARGPARPAPSAPSGDLGSPHRRRGARDPGRQGPARPRRRPRRPRAQPPRPPAGAQPGLRDAFGVAARPSPVRAPTR